MEQEQIKKIVAAVVAELRPPSTAMQASDVRAVVNDVLAEQSALHNSDIDTVILKAMSVMLTSFGIEEDDRKEFQADFRHLRKWRKSVEGAESMTVKIILATLVSGFLGMLWMGVKLALGKS